LQHRFGKCCTTCATSSFWRLFNFIAIFTYVSFHLAEPPYEFSSTWLGAIFVTYLVGTLCTLLTGRAVMLFGRRGFIMGVLAVWLVGLALLLAPPIALIALGLSLCAGCGLLCQAISTGYVAASAREGRSSAIGLYVSAFYFGGSTGGFVSGLAWSYSGWPPVVALVALMIAAMAAVVASQWQRG
jgi:YNFM family putative membrane transporter